MLTHRSLAAFMLLTLSIPLTLRAAPQPDSHAADHQELRALRETIAKAVNTDNLDLMGPILHEPVSMTMVDLTVVTNLQEFKAYFQKMFHAEGAPLKSVHIDLDADMETVFVGENMGINRGNATDSYVLKDGRNLTFHSRWTGTFIKDGGKWKILTLQLGVNFLDNPVLSGAEKSRYLWGAGGIALGLLAMFLWKRCCRAKA